MFVQILWSTYFHLSRGINLEESICYSVPFAFVQWPVHQVNEPEMEILLANWHCKVTKGSVQITLCNGINAMRCHCTLGESTSSCISPPLSMFSSVHVPPLRLHSHLVPLLRRPAPPLPRPRRVPLLRRSSPPTSPTSPSTASPPPSGNGLALQRRLRRLAEEGNGTDGGKRRAGNGEGASFKSVLLCHSLSLAPSLASSLSPSIHYSLASSIPSHHSFPF